ncbi:uncharacterized protein LOC108415874 [Pygocentrus nattereri]|uniref:uncharacterized protein LOC108415874 n=1 Tax=Pygocentrus nattereri TaxID=42514 RepID=UPI0018912690|nr:uncharacterized protein LOC108415874 [Pygocentrus nattereri]
MLVIFGVLVVFAGDAMGLLSPNPHCRFTQSDPCYGAVGRPLYLQLPSAYDLILKKSYSETADCIFRYRNQTITQNHPGYPRWQFVTKETTMNIRSAEKRDSGRYILETFDSKGTSKGIYYPQLVIEAAVSSVEVEDSCFSSLKRRVSCSSDGDPLHIRWTLSGFALGYQLVDGNKTLLLDRDDAGNVTCYVQNNISRLDKATELGQCPDLISGIPVCRFYQSDPCYGAVGHPLHLQLPSEDELDLKKSNSVNIARIFKFRKQKVTQNHFDHPRWQFVTDNRTMIISSAEKRDSGRYTLDTFDSKGTSKGFYHLQLVIEAVVSSVTVTKSCLSIEKRNVYCSSDGDNVHYNWTFPHTHQLADGNPTLLLDKEAHGSVTCYAQNHVSHGQKTIEIQQCPDPTTVTPSTSLKTSVTQRGTGTNFIDTEAQSPTHNHTSNHQESLILRSQHVLLIALGSAVVVLIVLSIILYVIYRKKQAPKNIGSPQGDGELLYVQVTRKQTGGADKTGGKAQAQEEDVEYATVVTQPKKKKKQKQAEEEVQYGEVVFNTGGAKHQREQPKEQEDCVYSQVQHNR